MELFGNIHTQKIQAHNGKKHDTSLAPLFFRHFPSMGDLYFMNEKVFFLLDMITKSEQDKKCWRKNA